MRQKTIQIATRGQGLYEFTDDVASFVTASDVEFGLVTIFVRHTSCSLLIQENADPDVKRDLKEFFSRLVPPSSDPSMRWIVHTMEGPDDMPAHIKSALMPVSLNVPIAMEICCWGPGRVFIFSSTETTRTRARSFCTSVHN